MWTFAVASDFWRNFWTNCLVSPGHVARKLFLIADISIDVHGLHIARWRKVQRSAFNLVSYRLPEKWRSGIFTSVIFSFCLGFRGTMYRDDWLSLVTCMMCLFVFLLMMFTFLLSKIAMHPLSQNMLIERSALFFRSGKMCACRASMGRVSWGSRLVWEEKMICPSGMRMPSGFVAILLLTQGLFDLKKRPDVPESAAARLSTCLCVIVLVVSMMLIYLSSNLSHTRRQLSLLSSQPLFHTFPPIVSLLVAAVMWPDYLFLQLVLLCVYTTLFRSLISHLTSNPSLGD